MSTTTTATEPGFVARFVNLPIVCDGTRTIQSYAVGRLALDTAGAAVTTVSKYTSPVQERFSAQINKVDEIAVKSLEYVEGQFPIIGKPTDEVIKPFVDTYETCKQYQEGVRTAIEERVANPALEAVKNVQATLDQKVAEPARNLAKTVQERVSPIARSLDSRLTPAVDTYDSFTSKWIPSAEEDPAAELTEEQWSQAVRALNVSVRSQRRLNRRLRGQLTRTQNFTTEHLRQVQQTHVMQRLGGAYALAKETGAGLKGAPLAVRQQLMELTNVVLGPDFKNQPFRQAVQGRIRELLQLTNPLVRFLTERYEVAVAVAAKQDMSIAQKAKEIIVVTSDKTLPVLETALANLQETARYYRTGFANSLKAALGVK